MARPVVFENAVHTWRHALGDEIELSALDALTGLLTRESFEVVIADLGSRSQNDSSYVGLVLADVDDFIMVNHNYGHGFGDQVLAEVARRLGMVAPAGCSLARTGGDQFALLLPAVRDIAEIKDAARSILRAFDTPVEANESSFDGGNYADVMAAIKRAEARSQLPEGLSENEVREVNQVVQEFEAGKVVISPIATTIDLRLSLGVAYVKRKRARAALDDAAIALCRAKALGKSRAVCLDPSGRRSSY